MKIFFKYFILVGLIITAPVHAVNQCKGRVSKGVCLGYIYDDHVRCPDNKPSSSCYNFGANSGSNDPAPRTPKLINNVKQKVYSPRIKAITR